MTNKSLRLIDPNFKAEASENCNLLLKITNDSFSYAIVDQNSGQINALFDAQSCEDVEQAISEAFKSDQLLSQHYKAVKAAVHTSNFLFIPDKWYDSQNLDIYHKFIGSENEIRTQHHDDLGFKTLFSLNNNFKEILQADISFFPQSSPLIALFNLLDKDALLIDFTATSFNVLFIKNQRVVFQNHYDSATSEEFNYFLLLIIEQLTLTDAISVYIQGIINEDDAYYNTLLKYFNNLYFFHPAGKEDSELLADMPKHYFSGLLAIDLCE